MSTRTTTPRAFRVGEGELIEMSNFELDQILLELHDWVHRHRNGFLAKYVGEYLAASNRLRAECRRRGEQLSMEV